AVPQEPQWPENDDDETEGSSAATQPGDDAPTSQDESSTSFADVGTASSDESTNTTETTSTISPIEVSGDDQPTETDAAAVSTTATPRRSRNLRRTALVAGATVAVLALVYGIDLL